MLTKGVRDRGNERFPHLGRKRGEGGFDVVLVPVGLVVVDPDRRSVLRQAEAPVLECEIQHRFEQRRDQREKHRRKRIGEDFDKHRSDVQVGWLTQGSDRPRLEHVPFSLAESPFNVLWGSIVLLDLPAESSQLKHLRIGECRSFSLIFGGTYLQRSTIGCVMDSHLLRSNRIIEDPPF